MKVRAVAVAVAVLLLLASATVFAQTEESGEGASEAAAVGESESSFMGENSEGSAGEAAAEESSFESSFESGEDGSHGQRCGTGEAGDKPTCQQLGLSAKTCCSGSGYCSAAAYACNKKLGCKSGPCRNGFGSSSELSAADPVAAEESTAPPKTITKVISNAVPLCADCGKRGFQSATDDYSIASGNLYIDPTAPASVQAQQAAAMALAGSAQMPASNPLAGAFQQQQAAAAAGAGGAVGAAAAPALGASWNPLQSTPDPSNPSDLVKRIQLEGTLRTKAILDAANAAAAQIVGTANQVGSKGRGKAHKKTFLVPVEGSTKKSGDLTVPVAERKKETSDMKLPEF